MFARTGCNPAISHLSFCLSVCIADDFHSPVVAANCSHIDAHMYHLSALLAYITAAPLSATKVSTDLSDEKHLNPLPSCVGGRKGGSRDLSLVPNNQTRLGSCPLVLIARWIVLTLLMIAAKQM